MESKQEVFEAAIEAISDAALSDNGSYESPEKLEDRYAAASDETEAQRECLWCNPAGEDNLLPLLPNLPKGVVAAVSSIESELVMNVTGTNYRFPITHCPMCGRSLGGAGNGD